VKITRFEAYALRAPPPQRPHWTSHFIVPTANELLVRLYTDEGIDGFGLATSYTPMDYVLKAVKGGILELVAGEDALAPERLYRKLFDLTTSKAASSKGWSRDAVIRVSAAVDIAVWDIVGKAAGLPLYRLFGGARDEVPAYVTCGYYRDNKDNAELRDEVQRLVAQGHTGFKAKAGGIPLHEDIERLGVMREVIGPECDFMVDPNRAWDLDTAIEAARLLEPLNPRWLEEPVRWEDDRRMLKLLAQTTRIPLSAGESEMTSYACRALLEEQAIRILQFDCTLMGGFTEGRKLAALCELNHVQVAPHHDCFLHAHLVAGSPAGCIVEAFTDPERDPLQAELFENPPALRNGRMKLNQAPGLGLTLSPRALAKFGERIT
jgi:L-alanine-DL-glutamate epimerase-like enolase superfamily enzyme